VDDGAPLGFRVLLAAICGFAVLVGTAMVVGSLRSAARARSLSRTGSRVTATVVDNQTHSHGDHGLTFSPVVRFRDARGRERVQAVGDQQTSSAVVGTSLEVLYDPERDDRVQVATGRGAGPVTGLVFGLVFLAFGAGAWFGFRVLTGPDDTDPGPAFPPGLEQQGP